MAAAGHEWALQVGDLVKAFKSLAPRLMPVTETWSKGWTITAWRVSGFSSFWKPPRFSTPL